MQPGLPRARHAVGASHVLVGQGNEPVSGWVTGLPNQCGGPCGRPLREEPRVQCRAASLLGSGELVVRTGGQGLTIRAWQPLPAPRPVPPGTSKGLLSFLPSFPNTCPAYSTGHRRLRDRGVGHSPGRCEGSAGGFQDPKFSFCTGQHPGLREGAATPRCPGVSYVQLSPGLGEKVAWLHFLSL